MADLSSTATEFVESVVEMPEHFADVATHDPISAVLVGIGALLVFLPVVVLGYLSLGAFVSLFTVESSSAPSREVR